MHVISTLCPGCNTPDMTCFYELEQAPVNSVLLLQSREEAIKFPTGRIRLALCNTCGFIANVDFDPQLTQYTARYEATQGYSPTFNAFHRRLAEDLIAKYDLHHKDVIEIGCDKGDFLTMLCEIGENRGVGFDPAYVPGRHPSEAADQLTFIADFYSEKYAHYHADFFVCKMTLEHIPNTAEFMGIVRQAIGDKTDTVVFFQIPNAAYVLDDVAFWDIYYEHCSYFTKSSLAYLFEHSGFKVLDLWTDYDDQYLMISAQPTTSSSSVANLQAADKEETFASVQAFTAVLPQKIRQWQEKFAKWQENGDKVTLWGGGSKAVAFLTTLGITHQQIPYVVDINPRKTGTYLASAGQEIVAPDFLRTYQPDIIIIMNPIYQAEIGRSLQTMGLSPEIYTV